jgi:hypothetical protein
MIKIKFDMRWKYEYDENGYWNGNCHGWNIARIPAPDNSYVKIDPATLGMAEDEYGNRRYKKNGKREPVLNEQTPSQKQKDDLAEKEYKEKLKDAMPDIIDKCTSWAEVEAEKAKLRADVAAEKEKAK